MECDLFFFSLATKRLTQVFFKGITGGGGGIRTVGIHPNP